MSFLTPLPQAAVFDLDGTLLDSLDVWRRVDEQFFAARRLPQPADYSTALSGMHLQEAAVYTVDRFGLAESPQAVVEEWLAAARAAYAGGVPLKTGAADFLRWLGERGVRLAVATALARELAEPALTRHKVADLFETVVYASEVGEGKSSPAVYARAAQILGVSPVNCVAFEDSLAGVLCAKAAGMRVCAVADEGTVDEWAQITAAADATCRDFTELIF